MEQKPKHWKEHFKYDYLGSYSFDEGEKEKVLTIKIVEKRKVVGTGGKKEDLLICDFVEKEKPMILNRTNCKAIQKAYNNPYPEQWAGKRIAIYVDHNVRFGSETTEGLRVKDQIPGNEISAQQLIDLYELKKDALNDAERNSVEHVISTNEQSRFAAAFEFLKSK